VAGFVHLHVHTEYSLLDGAGRISQLASAAAAQGMPALALTDHGVMYGAVDFYKTVKKHGMKPVMGCEVYVARRSRHDRTPGQDDSQYHLVLLARDDVGYRNLLNLVSLASVEGFYYKPRVDRELLAQYSGGLIALSACLAGEIPTAFLEDRPEAAREAAGFFREVFGRDNFYLELQDHGLPEQSQVNRQIINLARQMDIPLVATNDLHYVTREQAQVHDVLLCIQTGKTLDDPNRLRFPTPEFYLKSEVEMARQFGEVREALTNTLAIADACNVEMEFGKLHLPEYVLPEGFRDAGDYLQHLCFQGLHGRYGHPSLEMVQRLEYELAVIRQMGFAGYFLIVWDLIAFARSRQIPVGPGRGSAAGSLVAYTLGITDIDPLRYGLLFERFLNPERVTMPDIDTDFCFERRGEVIEYVTQKYGSAHVAQIITFGTMAAKAAVRDVGRVMNIPLAEVDRVAKMIPNELGISVERALEISPELKDVYAQNPSIRQLLDTARALEGTPRHASTHAAGVVISQKPLTHYLPVQRTTEGGVTTQFPMQTVEEIGLLKMDILGLRTLTVIGDTVRLIKEARGEELDIGAIPMDDPATLALLGTGESIGVFQLESPGMRTILKNLQPGCFEDLIALVALYRPGPLGSGMVDDFIKRKHGETAIVYPHPALEDVLKETYGVILYQEQVMKIASELAGFTLGQADLLRRAMGKKKPEIIMAQREGFVKGAADRGVDPATAGIIFDLMEHFAGYGFNKSHSAAYALVAYQTAYLKTHYPVEFLAALLTSIMDNPDKVPLYIEECRRLGIQVLPPDINESLVNFTVVEGRIRFGLAAVKNVGRGAIENIISVRQSEGRFVSLQDFCQRVDLHTVNRRVMESLIRSGCLASLGLHRSQLLAMLDLCMERGQRAQADRHRGQISLLDLVPPGERIFDQLEMPDIPEFPMRELLAMEKDLLGFYISGHPVDQYRNQLSAVITCSLAEIGGQGDESQVTVGGVCTALRRTVTKRGETMAYLTLEDATASADILVFPKVYQKVHQLLVVDQVLVVKARLSLQEDKTRLFAEDIHKLPEPEKIVLRLILGAGVVDRHFWEKLKETLYRHRGSSPVHIYFPGLECCIKLNNDCKVEISQALQYALEELCGAGTVQVGMAR